MTRKELLKAARDILISLGLPHAQQNERSALTLLALLDLKPGTSWKDAKNPMIGITPIMDWIAKHYKKVYAPNTRETVRRQSIHQFLDAGIILHNPDDPKRPPNSKDNVYQIAAHTLALVRTFGTPEWHGMLTEFLAERQTLIEKYAHERNQHRVPVTLADGKTLSLVPGDHSELIKAIIEDFAERYVPGGQLIYIGDTGDKWGYFDAVLLSSLGITVDMHGKMPDVVLYAPDRNWLLLIESVTSHGPVNGKRHAELARLFVDSKAGLVYVTAFPTRALMSKYLGEIAWETEVWVADAPSHLIHFNGERFLGPYEPS
ncbi:BsuBI/PstI family type II restriction endonuclease [Terriglobus sp. 2YAB30_2]|uniref:BsuBI/PstI family type II restriction endonuclease n=1 Tax=unclassified Terriglobus TaxID=2628988 RepID=UPI003F9A16EC